MVASLLISFIFVFFEIARFMLNIFIFVMNGSVMKFYIEKK